MMRYANFCQCWHQMGTDQIIQQPLAIDDSFFLGIEGGGVILEILHQHAILWPGIENLGLAFIKGNRFCGGVCHQPASAFLPAKNALKNQVNMAEMLIQIKQRIQLIRA